MPSSEIFLRRDHNLRRHQLLAKQQEETLLYRDMQNDLVQRLMRRPRRRQDAGSRRRRPAPGAPAKP